MKRIFKYSLALVLLLGASSLSLANETGYEVELIIFENANGRYLNSEDWSFNDKIEHKVNEALPDNPISNDKEFKELDWNSARLAKNLNHLLKNNNYKVLVHKRWKQTGLDRKESLNIPINTRPAEQANNSSTENAEIIGNINPETKLESYITGDVRLIMSRYLHFNVNLKFFKPLLNNNAEYEFKPFPVISERRMKSKEIHYIDHPLVGVVVLATPYKIKTEESGS